ncbi:hypothetical protein P7H25_08765 [Paenibacillus larvae]|nr:hypothetical protein [Paenibacillus larvae]MDT2255712.1 hypothetical protein [Paenibacillus larvae]
MMVWVSIYYEMDDRTLDKLKTIAANDDFAGLEEVPATCESGKIKTAGSHFKSTVKRRMKTGLKQMAADVQTVWGVHQDAESGKEFAKPLLHRTKIQHGLSSGIEKASIPDMRINIITDIDIGSHWSLMTTK